jgi:hypothetical protein
MPEATAELLFQIISGGPERAAVIVTTNLPLSELTTMFANARLCKALLDRLTDQAHVLTSIAIEIASTDLIQHWSKIKHMIGSIGISLGKRLRQPCIVPIDVIVEIHTTLFIHSCGCVQDQHGNR